MKSGLSVSFIVPKPQDQHSDYRSFHQSVELVTLADELGFDSIWSLEHHFLQE